MKIPALLITCLVVGLAQGQIPVRIRSISTPNRFDFSQLTVDTDNGSLLVAGVDYLIRITPDFQQSTITNVPNLDNRVDYVGYNANQFIVCFREGRCNFYNSDNIQTETGSIVNLPSSVSPQSAVFGEVLNTPAVYISASFFTISLTTTRYSVFAYQLNNLGTARRTLTGQPILNIRRTLITSFKHQNRIFFLYRQDAETRLLTLCDNTQQPRILFASLVEIKLAPCVPTYGYLASGRVLTLQDNSTHLVLVYRINDVGIESRLCALQLNDLNSFIANSFVGNSSGLLWSTTYASGSVSVGAFLSILRSACSLDQNDGSPSTPFALLMPKGGNLYPTVLLLTSTYSAEPNNYGRVTTLYLTTLDSYFYFYIATESGVLIKYLVNTTSLSPITPILELEARRLSNTFSDRVSSLELSGETLYALTARELFRIPVSDCGRHTGCEECVADPDPLCGWCGVQNTCNRASQCENSQLTNRWIDVNANACFSISNVSPNISNINLVRNVSITATNLPQLSGSSTFLCVFGLLGNTAVSLVSGGPLTGPVMGPVSLTCPMPTGIPPFTLSATNTFDFFLSSSAFPSTGMFSEFPFSLFDCRFHSSCDSCVSLSDASQCGWCAYSGQCQHAETLCPAFNRTGQLEYDWIQGDSCPSLTAVDTATDSFSTESMHTIILQGSNLPAPMTMYSYQCSLNVSGSACNFSADYVSSSSLSCSIPANSFSILSDDVITAVLSVRFFITPLPLQAPTIRVYNCSQQGETCSQCLSNRQQSTDQCGWCGAQSICTTTQLCSGMFLETSCPDPIITSIEPPSISVQYGGQIRIIGENFGTIHDVVSVSVSTNQFNPPATFECVNVALNLQNTGTEHTCVVQGLRTGGTFSDPGSSDTTTLTLRAGSSQPASHSFYIAFPQIGSVSSSFGPVAGVLGSRRQAWD